MSLQYRSPKRTGIQLAYPFEESRLLKWEPPYIVQPKLDGVRCRAVFKNEDEGYVVYSSEGNEMNHVVPHIVARLNSLGLSYEFDGEVYLHGMSFEDIFSRASSSRVEAHLDHVSLEFHIFDIIGERPQVARLSELHSKIFKIHRPALMIVSTGLAYDFDGVMRLYDKFISQGYEGMVVRNIKAPYIRCGLTQRRSLYMMKFKPKQQDIYPIVGCSEEIDRFGNPRNRLGALECSNENGAFTFKVGTGFDVETRANLWMIRDELEGMFVEVKYQHLTSGKNVPRFPVFSRIVDPCEYKGGE
jgi:ATP-dependent DNA ligase